MISDIKYDYFSQKMEIMSKTQQSPEELIEELQIQLSDPTS